MIVMPHAEIVAGDDVLVSDYYSFLLHTQLAPHTLAPLLPESSNQSTFD